MQKEKGFWQLLDGFLGRYPLVIERPKGTPHPRYPGLIYPVDYGYLEGAKGGDGMELDVWKGTAPTGLIAIACTADTKKRDAEVKLLVGCTAAEQRQIQDFMNQSAYMKGILVQREE